jgi:hypothetical protein
MPGNARAGGILVHKEMSISHRDFLRILPGALEDGDFRIDGHRITAGEGARRLEIELSPETQRRIALLTLPVTHVSLEFVGYDADEADAALVRFDRAFQRGGG